MHLSFGDGIESFLPFMIFAIPIVAIVGGITAGIVKTLGQQRLMELAQRERIAAIERGVDPSKLPPMPIPGDDHAMMYHSYGEYALRRSHGLMIGGIVTLAVGIGLTAFLYFAGGDRSWSVGIIPLMVGLALLVSAWVVRPKGGADTSTMPRN
jgi:hypothetical protein